MKYYILPILLLTLVRATSLFAETTDLCEVKLEMRIICPKSIELEHLVSTIPLPGTAGETKEYDEWAESCTATLNALILLIQSKEICNANYSIGCSPFEGEIQSVAQ